MAQKTEICHGKCRNNGGEGENAGYPHFSFSHDSLQKVFSKRFLKLGLWKKG